MRSSKDGDEEDPRDEGESGPIQVVGDSSSSPDAEETLRKLGGTRRIQTNSRTNSSESGQQQSEAPSADSDISSVPIPYQGMPQLVSALGHPPGLSVNQNLLQPSSHQKLPLIANQQNASNTSGAERSRAEPGAEPSPSPAAASSSLQTEQGPVRQGLLGQQMTSATTEPSTSLLSSQSLAMSRAVAPQYQLSLVPNGYGGYTVANVPASSIHNTVLPGTANQQSAIPQQQATPTATTHQEPPTNATAQSPQEAQSQLQMLASLMIQSSSTSPSSTTAFAQGTATGLPSTQNIPFPADATSTVSNPVVPSLNAFGLTVVGQNSRPLSLGPMNSGPATNLNLPLPASNLAQSPEALNQIQANMLLLSHLQQTQSGLLNQPLQNHMPFAAFAGAPPLSFPAVSIRRPTFLLYTDRDEEILTDYQCMIRKQIEVFEAAQEDVQSSAQGRNTPIVLGQVGLRCRFCAKAPRDVWTKGSSYYSKTVEGIYQVAQNMAKVHLSHRCHVIPRDLKAKLKALRLENDRARGGKVYWIETIKAQGVYQDDHGTLRLRPL